MHTLEPSLRPIQADCFEPTLFIRHHRMLRALTLESQAWFCLSDLARLMGRPLDERSTYKLDLDQHRTAWLLANGEWTKNLMVSESGVFALLVHHYVPENRSLRHWLTHEVLPALRDNEQVHQPNLGQMQRLGTSLSLLHWRSEPRIRLRDMPEVMAQSPLAINPSPRPWWRRMRESFSA
jgi:prophage antirepressor-like protein